MNIIFHIKQLLPYLENCIEMLPTHRKTSTAALKTLGETISYEDKDNKGQTLSSTKVERYYPNSSVTSYKCHKSLRDLCKSIAQQRGSSESSLAKDSSTASFSSKNRGDLKTKVTLSEELKNTLGLNNQTDEFIENFLSTESNYEHNSEFNGHSYLDKNGRFVQINSAIESSADRKALHAQNLSVVKQGGENLLYTGRPDTLPKAKEQALFIMSHKKGAPILEEASSSEASKTPPKWLEKVKGLSWNPTLQCVEFPYAVYSLMSDSLTMSKVCDMLGTPENNERKFLKEEIKTLKALGQESFAVKDAEGHVFNVRCKPILLSQGFNAFSTLKAFTLEGGTSSPLMAKGFQELKEVLNERSKEKLKPHIETLEAYFAGKTSLSSLHLFLHMNMLIMEISGENEELPLVLHCKSSTDRTGIGAAVLASVKQMKKMGEEIPADMSTLTQNVKFKELFALNWIPTWHQRSEYSRDVAGISFGKDISQNPVVAECLPERYLTPSKSLIRWTLSGIFGGFSVAISELRSMTSTFTSKLSEEGKAFDSYLKTDLSIPYYPHVHVNKLGGQYRSTGIPLSPLQKEEKN